MSADASAGNRIAETHTGLVFLVGEWAYKVKKPVVTDFLDFSRVESREAACAHEVTLNRRLSPGSYLGVGHFAAPGGGAPEPVIVMRRHPDRCRLATLVRSGADVTADLTAIARLLAGFHDGAARGPAIDAQAQPDAVAARWADNIAELRRYAADVVPGLDGADIDAIEERVSAFISGRSALFGDRIARQRIVDGHADLLADDIFCLPDGPALLDCLEFDDRLRYVDVIDDVAFLAMDLEFLGRPDLADFLLARYTEFSGDRAPQSLRHFYVAYRAVVRAKVDCVRHTQGDPDAAAHARHHLAIASEHLRRGAVRLILVGGEPGTGKTTLARALAERLGAQVISTDDVRAELLARGEIKGTAGVLGEGLYAPANVAAVYRTVLRHADRALCEGHTVILDGTWTDPGHRGSARDVASQVFAPVTELVCVAPLDRTVDRIRTRSSTTSQVTPEIAAALAARESRTWPQAHRIDTTRPPAESVAEAMDLCLG